MKKRLLFPRARVLVLIVLVGILLGRLSPTTDVTEQAAAGMLRFESNVGQTSRDVRFLSRAPGYLLLLKSTEADFVAGTDTPMICKRLLVSGTPALEVPPKWNLWC